MEELPECDYFALLTPDGYERLSREELVAYLVREYNRTYKRPGESATYHLCPPPDDGSPCSECVEYWRDMVAFGLYTPGIGWHTRVFSPPPPEELVPKLRGGSRSLTTAERLDALYERLVQKFGGQV